MQLRRHPPARHAEPPARRRGSARRAPVLVLLAALAAPCTACPVPIEWLLQLPLERLLQLRLSAGHAVGATSCGATGPRRSIDGRAG